MADLNELLESIDPEDFIAYLGAEYKNTTGKSGEQLNVKECPRCGGTGWKVFLNAETGIGTCFHGSCSDHPGMNLFSFAKATLGSAKEAADEIRRYAESVGWRPSKKVVDKPVKEEVSVEEKMLPSNVKIPLNGKNLGYLAKRGFSKETAEHFDWRYCDKGFFKYTDFNGNPARQYYDQRVLIPVYDMNGELKTFQGRDVTGEEPKKYLFPPGLPGTARFLYNAYRAVGAQAICMAEGAMDVAAIHQAFEVDPQLSKVIPVGTFGKVLSEGSIEGDDQLGELLRLKQAGLQRITIMWDSEVSTLIAALKCCIRLYRLGFKVFLARLPGNADPNEVEPHVVRSCYRSAASINPSTAALMLAKLNSNIKK